METNFVEGVPAEGRTRLRFRLNIRHNAERQSPPTHAWPTLSLRVPPPHELWVVSEWGLRVFLCYTTPCNPDNQSGVLHGPQNPPLVPRVLQAILLTRPLNKNSAIVTSTIYYYFFNGNLACILCGCLHFIR